MGQGPHISGLVIINHYDMMLGMRKQIRTKKGRAKPGQGEHHLKAKARELAATLGHELRHFKAIKQKADAVVLTRIGRAVPPTEGWRARCEKCLVACATILPAEWEKDRTGIGGSALRERCTRAA